MKKNISIVIGAVLLVLVIWLLWPKGRQKESLPDIWQSGAEAKDKTEEQLYQEALKIKNSGDILQARELFKQILIDHPSYENIEAIQNELENLNMRIVFSNAVTADTVVHQVQTGDTLGKIAKQYKTTVDLIKISNRLKGDVIRAGQKLRVWTAPFNIYVDKSQNVLLLKKNDEVLKVYSVSTGENNSTPIGEYKIVNKLVDPVWFKGGAVVPPESPENVLGSRWMGFDLPGYGIHGTVDPETIGQQVTAGCVRMRKAEVEELYSIIPMGTSVVIVD